MTHADVSRRDVTFADLLRLRSKGIIGPFRFGPAAFSVRDHGRWGELTNTGLLVLGTGHLIAALVYFFASYWNAFSVWQKFGLVQGVMVMLVVSALIIGLARPAGEMLLIAATIMIGVVLSIVEQVYPTSLGRLEFFLAWVLLALPFVVASRSAAHWIVWAAILVLFTDNAITAYLQPAGLLSSAYRPLVLAFVPALLLCAGEVMRWRGASWLRTPWPRYALELPVFGFLFTGLIAHLADGISPLFGDRSMGIESIVVFTAAAAAAIWLYRFRDPDYAGFAIATGFGFLALGAVGIKVIAAIMGLDPLIASGLFGWLLVFVWVSFCAGMMALLLRQQNDYFDADGRHAG